MSSNESSSDQDKLSAQIEAIQAEVRSIKGAMSGAKTARWLVLLGLLVLIGIFTGLGIGMVLEFQSSKNMDQLVTATQDRLEQSSDRYMAEVQTLVDFTTPRLTEAFYNQTKKDMPKYTLALERERDQLLDTLHEQLQAQITKHYEQSVKRHEAILTSEFPQFGDKKQVAQMMANMQIALEHVLEKHYGKHLKGELQEMFETWDGFALAELPKAGEPPLEDQLIDALLRLATLKLAETHEVKTSAAPAVPGEPATPGTSE